MLNLGVYNQLTILRRTSVGMYLGDEDGNDVLLPNKYIEETFQVGDVVEVFVYKDYEQRWIATTLKPYIQLHQFAFLRVRDVSPTGAFVEWGLEKDLLVPFKEQNTKMQAKQSYVVYLYKDEETERLVASCKLNRFLQNENLSISAGEEVDLLVFETTALGFNVIINQQHKGLIYHTEIFQPIHIGDQLRGFVKLIREDNGIDISLQPKGVQRLEEGAEKLINYLKKHKGFLPLTDKSEPDDILKLLQMSKKNFKKSLGILYKQRLVRLENDGTYLA
jgi:hypothetical protein